MIFTELAQNMKTAFVRLMTAFGQRSVRAGVRKWMRGSWRLWERTDSDTGSAVVEELYKESFSLRQPGWRRTHTSEVGVIRRRADAVRGDCSLRRLRFLGRQDRSIPLLQDVSLLQGPVGTVERDAADHVLCDIARAERGDLERLGGFWREAEESGELCERNGSGLLGVDFCRGGARADGVPCDRFGRHWSGVGEGREEGESRQDCEQEHRGGL